MEQLIHIMEV